MSYILCTAPRTGSSLLASALWRTNVAGRPAEYFDIHAHNEAHWVKHLEITADSQYIERMIPAASTPNGVMGFKLHYHQSTAMRSKLLADHRRPSREADPTGHAVQLEGLLRDRFGEVRYIWLRRRNVVAQAISYYRASISNQWRLSAKRPEPVEPASPIAYDQAEIHRYVVNVTNFNRGWYSFFMRHRLRALIVNYEDFIREHEKTVRGVLNYLDLDAPGIVIGEPEFRRQAGDESAEWERRYRASVEDKKAVAVGTAAQAEAAVPGAATPAPPPATRYAASRPRRRGTAVPRRAAGPAIAPVGELPFIAYDLGSTINLAVETAQPGRAWMNATPQRFAYRCLPLVIANQAGWMILNSHKVTVVWDGSERVDGLQLSYDAPCEKPCASSHFGSGVLTFSLGLLFRTPPGFNLHVRGPANWPKDGICALDGIVETDWLRSTFTMNWKMTRSGFPVTFEAGEPIAMVSPIRRDDLERFRPEIQPVAADAEWNADYTQWSKLRTSFNTALKERDPEAVKAGWQRHYLLGVTIGEQDAPEHQTALTLAPFADKRPPKG